MKKIIKKDIKEFSGILFAALSTGILILSVISALDYNFFGRDKLAVLSAQVEQLIAQNSLLVDARSDVSAKTIDWKVFPGWSSVNSRTGAVTPTEIGFCSDGTVLWRASTETP